MSIDFQHIRDIFQTVAELPASERAVVLDRECAGDTELRRRVDALLKAHDDSGELPAVEPLSTKSPAQQELPADELEQTIGYVQPIEPGLVFAGRYKLREKLGEGGMGVVFVADQIAPVQRRVALKVIRSGLDTRQLLARFEQERQALALMNHPNIAKVFDAGIDEAHRPYFAMELVKGLPLTKYCDEARLSPRQRIELFIPVCQAVQHAHQKGIIHRDLKPSNILVGLYDGRPVPKVIDFGVAKVTGTRLTDQSVYTEIGSIIGTLEYMSPEQAELNNLDIDTRSDVYALGVILYELLTGTVPFSRKELEKAGLAEMLRVIKEEEPHKPSTKLSSSVKLPSIAASRQTEPKKLTALVRGELDWIVMKALEKDRGRRYETANGLGQDVQRYLTGEPVLAAPASTAYRLRKLIRRNKGAVIAGSLVFAALLIGIAGTTWGLLRAEHHRQIAEQDTDKALSAAKAEKDAKERAEANFILAKESVEKYLGAVTDDPELKQGNFHQLRKKLLESAIPFFEKIAEQKSDDPEVEVGRGSAFYRLALVRAEMGENEAAIRDYESVQAIFAKLCTKFPTFQEYSQNLAASHINLGVLLGRLGKRAAAEAAYRHALEIGKKFAADFPQSPVYSEYLANCHNNLGNLLEDLGKPTAAESTFRQALDIYEKLAAESPNVPDYRKNLAMSHNNLGVLLAGLGNRVGSEAAFRRALAIREKLAADFPRVPEYRNDMATIYNNLGNLLSKSGKLTEVEAAYNQAQDILEKLAADFPNVPDYRENLAASHNNLGILLCGLGRRIEAELAFRQARDILEKLAGDFPTVPDYGKKLAACHNQLGILLGDLGKGKEAEAAFRQALGIQEKLAAEYNELPEYAVDLGGSFCNFGNLMLDSHKPHAALESFEKSIKRLAPAVVQKSSLAKARQYLRNGHWGKARALDTLGRHSDAIRDWERALELDDGSAKNFFRKSVASSHFNFGNAMAGQGKRAEAEAAYRTAMSIQKELSEDALGIDEYVTDLGRSYVNLGLLLQSSAKAELALECFDTAIATLTPFLSQEPTPATVRQILSFGHWGRAGSLVALSRHSESMNDWERALDLNDGTSNDAINFGAAEARLRMGQKDMDVTGCIAAATQFESLKQTDAEGLYNASYFRAVCASVVLDDPKTPSGDAARFAREQADLAMAWLQKAVEAGYDNVEHMKTDADLNALRERDDFKKLLEDLTKAKESKNE